MISLSSKVLGRFPATDKEERNVKLRKITKSLYAIGSEGILWLTDDGWHEYLKDSAGRLRKRRTYPTLKEAERAWKA